MCCDVCAVMYVLVHVSVDNVVMNLVLSFYYEWWIIMNQLLTLSTHAREGYSMSVCHFFILEKAPFSGLKLTSVHSRCPLNVALFLKIEAILEKRRVELRP